MPSYLKPIPKRYCERNGCLSLARHELHNDRNALVAYFCKPCGERELAKRLRDEGATT